MLPGNELAWNLYQQYDSRWHFGMSGYRTHYDDGPALAMAERLGLEGVELLDVAERLKVIEQAVLEIEGRRYEWNEQQRAMQGAQGARWHDSDSA